MRPRKRATAKRPGPAQAERPGPRGEAPAPLGARGRALVAGVLVAAWAVLFAPQLTGRVFVIGDAGLYSAYAGYSRARFEQTGERTFWNPYVFLGVPATASLADPRPQWLPSPLLRAWDVATGSPRGSLALLLAELLGGALAMAALARALFGCGAASMALAGLVPLASTAVAGPLAFGHDAQTSTVALTPLVLLAVQRFLAGPPGTATRRGAVLALAVAALAMAGHPQFAFFGALLALALVVGLARGPASPARLAGLALSGALGLALSAPAWLPVALYGPISVRANAAALLRDLALFSGNGRDVLALFWPGAAGFGSGAYTGGLRATDFPVHVGVVVGLSAALGFLPGRRTGTRAAAALAAVAALAMAASLGVRFPALLAVLRAVPVASSFRTPIVWLVPGALALALLAARGLRGLEGGEAGRRRLAWVLVAVAAAEMALASIPVLRRASGEPARLRALAPTPVALAARGDSLHRTFARDRETYFSNAWIDWRVRAVGGLHGAVPRAWDDARAATLLARPAFLRAIAVRLMTNPDPSFIGPADLEALENGGLALQGTLPRAYAVPNVESRPDEAAVRAALADPGFDPRVTAYVADARAAGPYPGSARSRIEWRRDDPDRVVLATAAPERAFVVVADAWAPGWSARIDGREAPLVRANTLLRGVAVPAGEHELTLEYVPPGWRAGRALAALGALAWLAAVLAPPARRRSAPGGNPGGA